MKIVDDADDSQIFFGPPDPQLFPHRILDPEVFSRFFIDHNGVDIGREIPGHESAFQHFDVQDIGKILVTSQKVHVQWPLAFNTLHSDAPIRGSPSRNRADSCHTQNVSLLPQPFHKGIQLSPQGIGIMDDHYMIFIKAQSLILDVFQLPKNNQRPDDEQHGHGKLKNY